MLYGGVQKGVMSRSEVSLSFGIHVTGWSESVNGGQVMGWGESVYGSGDGVVV